MNLYEALDVPRDAGPDAIKAAHRKAVRKHHPDAGGDRAAFELAQRAYTILSDAEKRARYDRTGESEDAPDNGLARSANYIMAAFDSVMAANFQQYETLDVIAYAKLHLEGLITQSAQQEKRIEEDQALLAGTIERLSFTGDGPDVIIRTLMDRHQQAAKSREALIQEVAFIKCAIVMLEGYSFRRDEAPARQAHTFHTFNIFTVP